MTPSPRPVLRRRSVCGLLLTVLSVLAFAVPIGAADAARPSALSRFRQELYGHDRYIHVTSKGIVTEGFLSGCCPPRSIYKLRLTHVRYSKKGYPVAHVEVIGRYFDKGAYRFPGVHVGSTGTAQIRNGVYRDTILDATFCTEKAGATGVCGA